MRVGRLTDASASSEVSRQVFPVRPPTKEGSGRDRSVCRDRSRQGACRAAGPPNACVRPVDGDRSEASGGAVVRTTFSKVRQPAAKRPDKLSAVVHRVIGPVDGWMGSASSPRSAHHRRRLSRAGQPGARPLRDPRVPRRAQRRGGVGAGAMPWESARDDCGRPGRDRRDLRRGAGAPSRRRA